jgi:hypothetical protein
MGEFNEKELIILIKIYDCKDNWFEIESVKRKIFDQDTSCKIGLEVDENYVYIQRMEETAM